MKSSLAFTAITVLSAAAAFAQTQSQPSSAAIFLALDSDSSGGINQTEAQAHPVVAQNFAAADVNGDGIITREEFSASFTTQPEAQEPGTTQPDRL